MNWSGGPSGGDFVLPGLDAEVDAVSRARSAKAAEAAQDDLACALPQDIDEQADEAHRRRSFRARERQWALEARHAQIVEGRSLEILRDAAQVLTNRRLRRAGRSPRMGRRPISAEDMALIHVAMCLEHNCIRASKSGLELLVRGGLIERAPHPNTLTNWRCFDVEPNAVVGGPFLLGALHQMFELLLEPMCNIVEEVIIDSTGLTLNGNANWLDCEKGLNKIRAHTEFMRWHAVGCKDTLTVLAFKATECSGEGSADAFNAIPLLEEVTARGLKPSVVFGDAAYGGDEILAHIIGMNADPMIPLPEKFNPRSKKFLRTADAQRLHERFFDRAEAFWRLFGDRSIIESTINAFKDGTGEVIYALEVEQRLIECYTKAIVHNLRRLVWLELVYGLKGGIDLLRGEMFQSRRDADRWA
jgi:DDE family transposase